MSKNKLQKIITIKILTFNEEKSTKFQKQVMNVSKDSIHEKISKVAPLARFENISINPASFLPK